MKLFTIPFFFNNLTYMTNLFLKYGINLTEREALKILITMIIITGIMMAVIA